jgi:[FeFe] hydrogenase H-cluster maturation GTPase HydF
MENNSSGRENKPHIGIFGRCNAGKSSLLNFIVGSDAAIVSQESGTTTDVVRKSYEILGFAPVVFIDTAGIDDCSELGQKRIARTVETMRQIDLALLVYREWGKPEERLLTQLRGVGVPVAVVYNGAATDATEINGDKVVTVDAAGDDPQQRNALLDEIKRRLPENSYTPPSMFGSSVKTGDVVLLVCPIDGEAPAGRMILPQVQAIRELLDKHAVAIVVQPEEIAGILATGVSPALVVTDSQIFPEVRAVVPNHIELTSFSVLLAAAKGDYNLYLAGLDAVDSLMDGDRILIAESCTHQVSCDDIGRVKIPHWIEEYTGRKLHFDTVSGLAPLPSDISSYALMVQCGACMVTRSQLHNRLRQATRAGVAVTNYGMLIRKIRR